MNRVDVNLVGQINQRNGKNTKSAMVGNVYHIIDKNVPAIIGKR